MAEIKRVTVIRAGGMSSAEVDIPPGGNIEQLITLAAPRLGLDPEGSYRLLTADGSQIAGDVYNHVKDGGKITLAQVGEGG